MHHPASGLRRIPLPRTSVHKGKKTLGLLLDWLTRLRNHSKRKCTTTVGTELFKRLDLVAANGTFAPIAAEYQRAIWGLTLIHKP